MPPNSSCKSLRLPIFCDMSNKFMFSEFQSFQVFKILDFFTLSQIFQTRCYQLCWALSIYGEDAQNSHLAPFLGDLSQSEKLSEIEPPLYFLCHWVTIDENYVMVNLFCCDLRSNLKKLFTSLNCIKIKTK